MAATSINRPRNHAHQPDAAAAVDQVDAPPHLRVTSYKEGKRHAHDAHLPRTQKIQEKTTAGRPAGAPSGAMARRASSTLPCTYTLTHQFVAELERGVREHLPVAGAAPAEDADRAEPAGRHGRRSVAHADRPHAASPF